MFGTGFCYAVSFSLSQQKLIEGWILQLFFWFGLNKWMLLCIIGANGSHLGLAHNSGMFLAKTQPLLSFSIQITKE